MLVERVEYCVYFLIVVLDNWWIWILKNNLYWNVSIWEMIYFIMGL